MATTTHPTHTRVRKANLTGLYVALAGIAIFNIAPFLDWFTDQADDTTVTGYEGDSLVPFIAYVGIGLAAALFMASGRAERRQHRGLTLTTMALGLGATLWTIATIIDVPGALERGDELSTEIGVYVALIGAAIWTVGAAILAKEVEGDPERDHTVDVSDQTVAGRQGAATR
jgi:drug/metabolite transporter (DMT)-like permease